MMTRVGELGPADQWLIERIETAARVDFYAAVPPDLRSALGVRVHRIGMATAFVANAVRNISFNRVTCLSAAGTIIPDDLESVMRVFGPAAATFAVQLPPAAVTADATALLSSRGFRSRSHWPIFYRDGRPCSALPPVQAVKEIGPEHADTFAQILVEGFQLPVAFTAWIAALVGRPGWRCYIADEGGSPVAAATMFVCDGVAWLGMTTTLPSSRRRGAQTALLARLIQDAAALGCTALLAKTDEPNSPSARNLMRIGFDVAYLRSNFVIHDKVRGSSLARR